jgi:hypothetical protein
MTAIRTHALARYVADQIMESVSETSSTKLYVAIGRPQPWANDAAPETPVHTTDEYQSVWNNMHFAKKITGNDISLIVRRIDWAANTVYTAFAHNVEMAERDFYVLTSDFNVYKCLENNRGAPSTIMPTYTGIGATNRTSDGYLWKYMYSLSRAQRLRFLTDDWMPVHDLTMDDGSPQFDVQDAAVDGGIEAIRVLTGGNNFSPDISATVTIGGDGSGARANIVANTITNTVQYIVVTSKGEGYTWANVNIVSSNTNVANGCTGEVIISPFGGHGSDPVAELYVRGLMIDVRLKGAENGLIKANNEFRQISLIRDPRLRSTSNIASNTIITHYVEVSLAGSSQAFIEDEWAYQGASLASASFKGRVLYINGDDLQLVNTSGTLISSTLQGANSAASRFVADYSPQMIQSRSGAILYLDNRTPIARSNVQTENIMIPLIF